MKFVYIQLCGELWCSHQFAGTVGRISSADDPVPAGAPYFIAESMCESTARTVAAGLQLYHAATAPGDILGFLRKQQWNHIADMEVRATP